MTKEKSHELRTMFAQVLRRAPAERADFARQLCQGRDEFLLPLLSLLRTAAEPATLETAIAPFPAGDLALAFAANEILLERFRIMRFLGQGGMGEVYEADDRETGRVALKTIRPQIAGDPQMLARFRREVQCARKVTGTNVCRIHELFSLPASADRAETVFLTMEFLEGTTLHDRIADGPAFTFEEAEKIAGQVCRGLQTIHEAEIIHRDLKSRNIMLAERKRGTEAVLMDFGLAHEAPFAIGAAAGASRAAFSATFAGTPEYMAPEQFELGPLSPASDIYSLGVLLYEVATGRLPFSGATPVQPGRGAARPLKPPSAVRAGLPARWDVTVERCLRYKPEERFQSALEVAETLVSQPAAPAAGAYPKNKIRLVTLGFAIALLLMFLGIVLYLRSTDRSSPGQTKLIAVLPFEDLSHDRVDQAFCDGLLEVMVSQLTELERFQNGLLVVPSGDLRHQHVSTAREAYKTFGANLVIAGSVQRTNHAIRLIVNLIDAKNLRQIRSKSLLIADSDPVAMQSGVVTEVASVLELPFERDARHVLAANVTTVPGAYDFYLQGYGYLRQYGDVKTVDNAIAEFQHALALDPKYALAFAGLGEAYWMKYAQTKTKTLLPQAWDSCHRALSLNDQLPAVHNTLGLLDAATGDYPGAATEFKHSLSLDPNNRDAYAGLARAYEKMGKTAEAEATFKQAIASKPNYWNSYIQLASFLTRHGGYQAAILPLQKVNELVPDNPLGHVALGAVYEYLGRDTPAEAEFQKALAIQPTAAGYSDLGTFYFYRNRFSDAIPLYSHAVDLAPADFNYWGNLADANRLSGDQAKAKLAYQKAIDLCREALKINKADAFVMGSLASYLAKFGQRSQAIALAQKVGKKAAGNSEILYDLAIAYELCGQREQALAALRQALSMGFSKSIVDREPDLSFLRQDPLYANLQVPK